MLPRHAGKAVPLHAFIFELLPRSKSARVDCSREMGLITYALAPAETRDEI